MAKKLSGKRQNPATVAKEKPLPVKQKTKTEESQSVKASIPDRKEFSLKSLPGCDTDELRSYLSKYTRTAYTRNQNKEYVDAIIKELSKRCDVVQVIIPKAAAPSVGFGSTQKPYSNLKSQRISRRAGLALSMLRSSLVDNGERLDSDQLVQSKENAVNWLLEQVADEMGV